MWKGLELTYRKHILATPFSYTQKKKSKLNSTTRFIYSSKKITKDNNKWSQLKLGIN